MKIGIPKEIKDHEYRVGATPELVRLLTNDGHDVLIETNAGEKIGFSDEMYEAQHAKIVKFSREVYEADMILKVKEPLDSEIKLLKKGQILFSFLHLAADPSLLSKLLDAQVVAIAFETVIDHFGRLPLLMPMSEIAGSLAVQMGAYSLQNQNGGKGLLLGGVLGVAQAKVVILGGGMSGTSAARVAIGMGAEVTLIEKSLDRLRELDGLFGTRLKTLYSTPVSIEEAVKEADLLIGAVLIPGKRTPRLITEKMIQSMGKGSVFVDISIDQGGCSETSGPTTHSKPTFEKFGVIHNCITNMPGVVGKTASIALSNALAPYLLKIANLGYNAAFKENEGLKSGLNLFEGKVVNKDLAEDLS